MNIPVYQWDTGELREQEIPIPMVQGAFSRGEVYRLHNGIMAEKIPVPAMTLTEFMEFYPDVICKKNYHQYYSGGLPIRIPRT